MHEKICVCDFIEILLPIDKNKGPFDKYYLNYKEPFSVENISGLPFHAMVSTEIIPLHLFSYLVFQIFVAINSLRNSA